MLTQSSTSWTFTHTSTSDSSGTAVCRTTMGSLSRICVLCATSCLASSWSTTRQSHTPNSQRTRSPSRGGGASATTGPSWISYPSCSPSARPKTSGTSSHSAPAPSSLRPLPRLRPRPPRTPHRASTTRTKTIARTGSSRRSSTIAISTHPTTISTSPVTTSSSSRVGRSTARQRGGSRRRGWWPCPHLLVCAVRPSRRRRRTRTTGTTPIHQAPSGSTRAAAALGVGRRT
mmetsp:Transcript_8259/g.23521  ORF Transcript_8259/g.23521 Transcript_8259/m.23521 type:complete len:231 (+) Transcript_8259:762-1454(+)